MPDQEDYYGDGGDTPTVTDDPHAGEQADQEDGPTTVVPKEVCPDMPVGEVLPLRIVRETEDSYECVYEPKEKSEGETAATEKPAAVDDGSMASMMQ